MSNWSEKDMDKLFQQGSEQYDFHFEFLLLLDVVQGRINQYPAQPRLKWLSFVEALDVEKYFQKTIIQNSLSLLFF